MDHSKPLDRTTQALLSIEARAAAVLDFKSPFTLPLQTLITMPFNNEATGQRVHYSKLN
jgi:hypothetical protein